MFVVNVEDQESVTTVVSTIRSLTVPHSNNNNSKDDVTTMPVMKMVLEFHGRNYSLSNQDMELLGNCIRDLAQTMKNDTKTKTKFHLRFTVDFQLDDPEFSLLLGAIQQCFPNNLTFSLEIALYWLPLASTAVSEWIFQNRLQNKLEIEYGVDMTILANPLRQNSSLQTLIFCHCELEDDAVEILGRVLSESNHALQRLEISQGDFPTRGIEKFAQMLPAMKGLRTLILNCGWMMLDDDDEMNNNSNNNGNHEREPEAVAQALLAGVKANFSLTKIFVARSFAQNFSSLIAFYPLLNYAGRYPLFLDSNHRGVASFPLGLWTKVFCRINHATFVTENDDDRDESDSYDYFVKLTHNDIVFRILRESAPLIFRDGYKQLHQQQ